MSRVKVELPPEFLFSMKRTVGISDVNYAKHLDSVAMVNILHEARLQFLASLGFTEGNIYGLGMVVTDLAIDYRSESFANDQLIIDVGVSDFNRYGFDIGLQIANSALESIVCSAKFGIVLFDFDRHQISEIPAPFRSLLGHRGTKVA
ncbi:MAG: acyl-CoA thioester hydrolase [Pseudohongiellaceae bacterium]|jgi:acyl-CoA thioester hydrolase